jgi:RNA polymerase sigma-70 factor, ECF subfamily
VADQLIDDAQWQRLLEEQVRANARLFFRIAWRMLRDNAAAEDVCQQAMLKAWSERHTIAQPDRLRAWLTRTVVNGALAMLRRRRVEQQAIAQWATPPNALSPIDAAADHDALAAALADLPETVRMVVILRIRQGLSGNEVRDLLGMSSAAISRALHQGLDQLRGILADDYSST